MKKLIVAVLAVLFVAPAAMAKGWGAGVKLGAGENDPKFIKDSYDNYVGSKEFDDGIGYGGLEALYEWDLADEANKIGAKLGIDFYDENKTKGKSSNEELTEQSYSFPVTIYYKRDNGIKNWSWFGGAGVTFLHSKTEYKGFGDWETSKNKVFPHIVAGGEYRFTKLFALGLEARYNIAAKVKKDGVTLSDRSGFGAALTGRFYF